jgi:hypothetical protein
MSGGARCAARCAALAAGPSRQDVPPDGEAAPPSMASPVLGVGDMATRASPERRTGRGEGIPSPGEVAAEGPRA